MSDAFRITFFSSILCLRLSTLYCRTQFVSLYDFFFVNLVLCLSFRACISSDDQITVYRATSVIVKFFWDRNKMFRRYSLLDSSPPSASVSIVPHRPRRRHQSVTHEIASSAPILSKPPSPKNILKPANSLILLSNKTSSSTSPSWYTRWGSSLRKNLLRRGLAVSIDVNVQN